MADRSHSHGHSSAHGSQPILKAALRASDTESSILMYDDWAGPKHAWQSPQVLSNIYWSLFYLSFVGIWAYQSLLSAQAYYSLHFPSAGLAFWGLVSFGTAMFVTHCIQATLDVERHSSHTSRVVPALAGFVVVALLVMIWRRAAIIIAAFALVGVFSALSQSPLYGLAGLFSTGLFTQALSAGNGLAGMMTVTAESLIRIIIVNTGLSRETAHLISFLVFISLLVVLGLVAIVVFLRLARMPVVQLTIADASVTVSAQPSSVIEILQVIWLPAATEFLVLFTTLAMWPGIPCSAHLTGWFASHPDWFCAPGVIAAFNYADLAGRGLAGLSPFSDIPLPVCGGFALLRCLLIPMVLWLSSSTAAFANWFMLFIISIVGLSNGLLATVAMMRAPQLFDSTADRQLTATIMVAVTYGGIACGSILPALLRST